MYFFRVTPVNGVGRTLKSKKLTPRFIGPYQITQRIGVVVYRMGFPPSIFITYMMFILYLNFGSIFSIHLI